MTIFAKVTGIFRSHDALVGAANAQDLAYNVGVGTPEKHKPFTIDDVEGVATNTPGLIATDSAANALARVASAARGENNGQGVVTEKEYIDALKFLAGAADAIKDSTLSKDDWRLYVAYQFANATWRTSNLWRGICAYFSSVVKKLEKVVGATLGETYKDVEYVVRKVERPAPYARLSGGANIQFNELPDDQIAKDLDQLVTGAKHLLSKIESTPTV